MQPVYKLELTQQALINTITIILECYEKGLLRKEEAATQMLDEIDRWMGGVEK